MKAVLDDDEKKELLTKMWKAYKRQKAQEADMGVEVKDDIERMSKVFKMALNGDLNRHDVDTLFPDEKTHTPGKCHKCDGTGKYAAHDVLFKFRHRDRRTDTAIVVCDCYEGQRHREVIKEMGKGRSKKGSRG